MTCPSSVASTTLRDAAHAYAAAGWPVFPLRPRDKRPITTTGFKAASTDPDLIDAWWDHEPEANIGLPTGLAFDVLDVDGEAGLAYLRDIWAHADLAYRHEGPVSLTGKGWHLLFAATGAGSGANLGGSPEHPTKLDYRGQGGYIVAPPSVHPLGHAYAWDRDRGPHRPLPGAPAWLTELLARSSTIAARPRPQLLARIDPREPAAAYFDRVAAGDIPLDQLPARLRTRLTRPPILAVCDELGIALRRRSHYYVARCLWHADDTPSLAIYPANNTFYCYGCTAHGDSFDLRTRTHI